MLTPEERTALVWKPFPIIRRLPCSYSWAGTLINRDLEGFGRRYLDDDDVTMFTRANCVPFLDMEEI